MSVIPTKLGAARLRAVKEMPYLSSAIYALQTVESNHPELKTMAVDQYWRMYYSPDFIKHLNVAELATCIIHEVSHLLREHAERRVASKLDPKIFNYAADCEINDDLRREHIVIPEGTIFPEDFNLEDGKMAEYYYQQIKDLFPPASDGASAGSSPNPKTGQNPDNPMNGASGSCAGADQPWEMPKPGSGNEGQNQDDTAPGINKAEADLIRKNVARDIQSHAKSRGSVPDGMQRWAKSQLTPAVNWRKELASSIRNALNMTSGAYDYTYSRPSRRTMPHVVMPSLQQPIPNVAVVIDTSGSMSDIELERAVTEVSGILKSSGRNQGVSILSVDAAVHVSKKVFSKNQIQLMGGGGTDMGRGIEAADKMKPRPDVCVVVTDGYTPWPDRAPAGMKVVVVLTNNGPEAPAWAKSIRLPDESENPSWRAAS